MEKGEEGWGSASWAQRKWLNLHTFISRCCCGLDSSTQETKTVASRRLLTLGRPKLYNAVYAVTESAALSGCAVSYDTCEFWWSSMALWAALEVNIAHIKLIWEVEWVVPR